MAKSFTQREWIDYDKFLSLVVIFKSIQILMVISAHYDYEIWQMDVKTTFMNDCLEENFYMAQPNGFMEKGQERKVCKLLKFIYGPKQSFRSWNQIFDEVIKTYGVRTEPL